MSACCKRYQITVCDMAISRFLVSQAAVWLFKKFSVVYFKWKSSPSFSIPQINEGKHFDYRKVLRKTSIADPRIALRNTAKSQR